MTTPPARTADELLAHYEPECRQELVRGSLVRYPFATMPEAFVATKLLLRLLDYSEHCELGQPFPSGTGFLLARDPDTVCAADVSFVRKERMPRLDDGFFPGPPDLAVEVTSPDQSYTAVLDKTLCWLDHGTPLVWVIDPIARRVTTYRSRDDIRMLGMDDALTVGNVAPGFAVRVRELFPEEQLSPARSHTMFLEPAWVETVSVDGQTVWPASPA